MKVLAGYIAHDKRGIFLNSPEKPMLLQLIRSASPRRFNEYPQHRLAWKNKSNISKFIKSSALSGAMRQFSINFYSQTSHNPSF